LATRLPAQVPVPVPLGEPVSQVRTHSYSAEGNARTRSGVWECTPGRWRRQVTQAEFCYFLEGEGTFTPDEGRPLEVRPGDAIYFPSNSTGVWEIRQTSRKVFIVFDEGRAP
jgi:uncharacterized cupin superfamily protein